MLPVNRDQIRFPGLITFTIFLTFTIFASAQTGVYTQNGGSGSLSDQTISATETGQSAALVTNSGNLALNNCTMTKTGDSASIDQSSQYGINAVVLANSGGIVAISGGSVTAEASGGNGLFATGNGSAITMTGGTIHAVGTGAHGVDVTYGGHITLVDVDVYTNGANSSALATDFGGGTVTVTGGVITSACLVDESHSAGIYSTGIITVSDAAVSSFADCGGVIDGANTIILNNTDLEGAIEGIKVWKTAPATGPATVTINGGSLSAGTGHAFLVTGATGNPANAEIIVSGEADITPGNNSIIGVTQGSIATLTVSGTTLAGNLYADEDASLTLCLQNGASLTGRTVNTRVELDGSSHWTLTSDTAVTVLIDAEGVNGTTVTNITGNGFHLYYDDTLTGNGWLNGETYTLVGGGYLLPVGGSNIEEEDAPVFGIVSINNYPNPFNPNTTITYTLPVKSHVTVEIYNILGRKIDVLVNDTVEAGAHEVVWDGSDNGGSTVSSGIYLIRLDTCGRSLIHKVTMVK